MGMKAIATALVAIAAVVGICAAETANAKARTAKLAQGVQTKATSSFARPRQMVPPIISNRKRLIAMDTVIVPGHVVYTWAQGASVWCETNTLKSMAFKAAKNRYSKLKIVVAAKAAGKWDTLKAGITAADLADEWNACQYIEDGDPSFVSATNAVVSAGIAEFLKTAIDN